MDIVMILAWLIVFAPLAALPLFPRVDRAESPAVERPPLREVATLVAERQERAA
jgi:hypothetical protein